MLLLLLHSIVAVRDDHAKEKVNRNLLKSAINDMDRKRGF